MELQESKQKDSSSHLEEMAKLRRQVEEQRKQLEEMRRGSEQRAKQMDERQRALDEMESKVSSIHSIDVKYATLIRKELQFSR